MNLRQHHEEQLKKDYDLLKKLEDKRRFENDPREQGKLEADIEEIKQKIHEREIEIDSIHIDVKPKNQLILEGCELLKNKRFDRAEDKFDEAKRHDNQSPEPWYWKAQLAIVKDNKPVALKYIQNALQLNSSHLPSIVLQIKLLLLMGGNYRVKAKEIASQMDDISSEINSWLDCLDKENLFSSIVITSYELDRKCPITIAEGKIV
ncbi:hypothetical protein H6G81_17795 [Scytonema hofmannii FACHB-248]|uniref:Tetratricopeptide repeat protein n=1 Tax=Scytonema hofmannii FACHB-248 TaxID=1842502 RepID=A0ABR8GSM1_9CYAN|nr:MULTISPECIES: hypothetical protein [Nostocales]MBD2606333.1 hypothetical protein [Scytonema hofmannii FACHB-248]